MCKNIHNILWHYVVEEDLFNYLVTIYLNIPNKKNL